MIIYVEISVHRVCDDFSLSRNALTSKKLTIYLLMKPSVYIYFFLHIPTAKYSLPSLDIYQPLSYKNDTNRHIKRFVYM